MEDREQAVRRWFDMWLHARDEGILSLFTPDCVYTESWGPGLPWRPAGQALV